MPTYDFLCQDCGRRVKLFFSYAEYGVVEPVCSYCGSQNLKRRIGRISVAKTEDARMDALLDDSAIAGLDDEDPRAIGKFMRKMGHEMGEDLGDEFGEVVDRLEKGQSPESIEKSMPDLGAEAGSDDMF